MSKGTKENKIDLTAIFGESVKELSSDQISVIVEKIETIVEARVQAKIDFQTELAEAEAKEKYDLALKESTSEYQTTITEMESALLEKATTYQNSLVERMEKFVEDYTGNVETELEQFKESLVDKIDKYLSLELKKLVPQEYCEAVAKVAVYEPIIEGTMKLMSENYMKCDTQGFGLLKEAQAEIEKLRKENARVMNEVMDLNKMKIETERSMKISKVCEGLTASQCKRAKKLLEKVDVSEIESRYEVLRDLILEETVSKKEEKTVVNESASNADVSKVVSEQKETVVEKKETLTESTLTQEEIAIRSYANEFRNRGWAKK